MADKPLISVIIPVYKVEPYIEKCLTSIVNQTYSQLEIILVDDGSPDRCPDICDAWSAKDNRIKVIHKENGGLGSARNAGLKEATGDYVGFVDSDDWVSEDMYAVLLNLAEDTNADITCGKIMYADNENPQIIDSEKVQKFSQDQYARKYFKIGSNNTVHYAVNKLYKKTVAKHIHYPEGVIDEDVEGFVYALDKAEIIYEIDHSVYFYRQDTSGISRKWFSEKQLDLLTVWNDVTDYCRENRPEWVEWADLNHSRAYFGLLTRLALNDPSEDEKYRGTQKNLIEQLIKVKPQLLNSNIPKSRKIMIQMMCTNYSLARWIIRTRAKIGRKVRQS